MTPEPEQVSTNPQNDSQPQINPLIPNGIENLTLRCVVCTNEVPKKRARGRSKDTCGTECNKILRDYRKWVIRSSHCPTCYHPSTPEERKLFLQWRKSRGDRREGRGRPPAQTDAIKALKLFILGFDSIDNVQMAGAADLARKVIDKAEGKMEDSNG